MSSSFSRRISSNFRRSSASNHALCRRTAAWEANCSTISTVQPGITSPRPAPSTTSTPSRNPPARNRGTTRRLRASGISDERRGSNSGSSRRTSCVERVVSARSTTRSIPASSGPSRVPLDARSARSSMGEASTRLRSIANASWMPSRRMPGISPAESAAASAATVFVSAAMSARLRRRFRSFTAESAAVAMVTPHKVAIVMAHARFGAGRASEQGWRLGERSRAHAVRDDQQEQRIPDRHLQRRAVRGEQRDRDDVHVDERLERTQDAAREIRDPRQEQSVDQHLEAAATASRRPLP